MEKEQNQNPEENKEPLQKNDDAPDDKSSSEQKLAEKTPDEKILQLEDKLART